MHAISYQKTSLTKLLHIQDIYSFHNFCYAKDFYGHHEAHDFYEFIYVDYGSIIIQRDEEIIPLHAHEAYLHLPNEVHHVQADHTYASTFIVSFACNDDILIHLSKQRLFVYQPQYQMISTLLEIGRQLFDPPYDQLFQEQLLLHEQADPLLQQFFLNTLEQLFLLFLHDIQNPKKNIPIETNAKEKHEEGILHELLKYLHANCYAALRVEDICEHFHFSKSTLTRICRRYKDKTMMELFQEMKMDEAKRLIYEGNHTLTEISDMLQYNSIHHFSKVFKQYTHQSPSAYARSLHIKKLL